MTSAEVSSVNSNKAAGSNQAKITSIKDLENNPEFFPLWMEEIQRKNMNTLLSATYTGDLEGTSGSEDSTFAGLSSMSSDPLSIINGTSGISGSDPWSGLFSSQSLDFSSLASPLPSLQSFEVSETLKGLQEYSNLKETKAWLGQAVTYLDPTDQIMKTGFVTRIDIENVLKPVFRIDDNVDVSLEDIKALNAGGPGNSTAATA